MAFPLPANEKARLEALRRYQILDTAPEQELEDITRLIAQLCGTPVSLITLLDENRQWFKSSAGLTVLQIPREHAFCGHTILQHNFFQVEDLSIDHRFADNILVTGEPNIRFYAGMPLTTPDGYALGALCVIDYQPRQLTTDQVFALQTLARNVMNYLELRLQLIKLQEVNDVLGVQRQKILDSIQYGKRIQTAVQPTLADLQRYLPECFLFQKPRDIVSGDFYYFTEDKYTGKLILAIADCTGHGVPGAFMSMIGSSLLNEIIKVMGIISPEEILFQLEAGIHKSLCQQQTRNQDGMEISICVIDPEKEIIEFAGANRELLILERSAEDIHTKTLTVLAGDRRSIGGFQRQREDRFTKHQIPYRSTTCLYLFSDGIADQFGGPDDRKLSKKGLRALILKNASLPMAAQGEALEEGVMQWMGSHKQIDDMLLVGLQCQFQTGSMRTKLLSKRKAATESASVQSNQRPS